MKRKVLIGFLSLLFVACVSSSSWACGCGDGIVDYNEECDWGVYNNDNGGCSTECKLIEGNGDGCTPGYWKHEHHFDSWYYYETDMEFEFVFDVDAFPNMNLLEVLQQKGGGIKALGRHTVAALLNASALGVSYPLSFLDVITKFQTAYQSEDKSIIEDTKDELESYNEVVCPLN
ncbi:MAG: hypothetical protein D3924_11695 [Candidatus Electrothrix sp. AR4]|nr:hypothetical protein [Candidatus Electrothrix sp. AR4]